jgi:hypothetical protein
MISRLFQFGLIAIGVLNLALAALLASQYIGGLLARSIDQ